MDTLDEAIAHFRESSGHGAGDVTLFVDLGLLYRVWSGR